MKMARIKLPADIREITAEQYNQLSDLAERELLSNNSKVPKKCKGKKEGDENFKRLKESVYNKYKNKPVVFNEKRFDSKKEYLRYVELLEMQDRKEITGLDTQTIFSLVPKSEMFGEVKYRADFTYYDKHGNYVVEDVKPFNRRTGKFLLTPVYELKKKLMYHRHKIIIKEY